MFKIDSTQFISEAVVKIFDKSGVIDKTKYKIDKDNFTLQFSDKLPEYVTPSKKIMLQTPKPDNKLLRKINVKNDTLILPNITLYKSTSIMHLIYIIGYIFNINISQIKIKVIDPLLPEFLAANDINTSDCYFLPTEFENEEGVKRIEGGEDTELDIADVSEVFANIDISNIDENKGNQSFEYNNWLTIQECISIGDTKEIIVNITSDDSIPGNNYEDIWYKEYWVLSSYYKQLEANNITSYPMKMNVSTIKISCIYNKLNTPTVDIAKLFNIHTTTGDNTIFSKVYCQSRTVDKFMYNKRPLQFVKTNADSNHVFKGVVPMYNTCVLYYGKDIFDGIVLQRIEILESNVINLIFTNTNTSMDVNRLCEFLKEWMTDNRRSIFKKVKISDCVYDLDFNWENYIPVFNGITASMYLQVGTLGKRHNPADEIDNLADILIQERCLKKFQTRSSLQFNCYSFFGPGIIAQTNYLLSFHEFLTNIILFKELAPMVHVGIDGMDDIMVQVSNASNIAELLHTFAFTLGNFSVLKENLGTSNITVSNTMSLESIRARSTKYGKKLLKILESIDPRLFGPRKIGKKTRAYSGLCQKNKQRAVPITQAEYEYLKKIVPDSVADLQNQTYPDQRICLFCPFKEYDFLNYHFFPNQLCIVRCTTKPSNRTQYNYCTKSLGVKDSVQIQNRYENQTIMLYNPLISPGRRCRLPNEWKDVLVNYVLYKPKLNMSIDNWCETMFNKEPFIIRRDPVNMTYQILSEYDIRNDYILIFQSEISNDYFVVVDGDDTNITPLLFSDNDIVKKFFEDHSTKTADFYSFFNFIERLLPKLPSNKFNYVKISDMYNNSIHDIITQCRKIYNLKYIVSKNLIMGIIYKDKIYICPKMFWIFDSIDSIWTIPLFKCIEEYKQGSLKLPVIGVDIPSGLITKYYKDYTTKKITSIELLSAQSTPTEPLDTPLTDKPVIIYDGKTQLMNMLNINVDKVNEGRNIGQYEMYMNIVLNWLYMYLNEHDIEFDDVTPLPEDEKNKFIEKYKVKFAPATKTAYIMFQMLLDNDVIGDRTYLKYQNNRHNIISWRSSKLSAFDAINVCNNRSFRSTHDVMLLIYNMLKDNMAFSSDKNEVISYKIITQ